MVDPKRHINILSPEEQAFIEECENEFANRFTDLDQEFKAHCQQPSQPPPIVNPWDVRRGGGGWRGHGGDRRFDDRAGRRNDSRNHHRGGYRGGNNYRGGRDNHASYSASNRQYGRSSNY